MRILLAVLLVIMIGLLWNISILDGRIATLEWKQMTPWEQCEMRGGQSFDGEPFHYPGDKVPATCIVPINGKAFGIKYTLQGSDWVYEDTVREVLAP